MAWFVRDRQSLGLDPDGDAGPAELWPASFGAGDRTQRITMIPVAIEFPESVSGHLK